MGIEREHFLVDEEGNITPAAANLLPLLPKFPRAGEFDCELSACQIETRSAPCATKRQLCTTLNQLDTALEHTLQKLGLQKHALSVAPADMPLCVYPDPDQRYVGIAAAMSEEVLRSACRVAGTHVHIGMPDAQTALRVYNHVITHYDHLNEIGDTSSGERLALYRVVAPRCDPVRYDSWDHFNAYAAEHGFAKKLRDCWHLIRLTRHGTIEFRNFGATDSTDTVIKWAQYCQTLCLKA